jgi:hypothetical protein
MRRRLAVLVLLVSSSFARAELVAGAFSGGAAGALPAGWKPLTFEKIPNHTGYALVRDGGMVVLEAKSSASASALAREIEIEPTELPIVEWRWKISNLIAKADLRSKKGDDYPARIYVGFAYDSTKLSIFERALYEFYRLLYGAYPPTRVLNYVWDGRAPAGTIAPNAYTGRVMMIVVESGADGVGEWREERRNLLEDYRRAFGEEPPAISTLAVMTDTDNTGEAVTSHYGDIVFRGGG